MAPEQQPAIKQQESLSTVPGTTKVPSLQSGVAGRTAFVLRAIGFAMVKYEEVQDKRVSDRTGTTQVAMVTRAGEALPVGFSVAATRHWCRREEQYSDHRSRPVRALTRELLHTLGGRSCDC